MYDALSADYRNRLARNGISKADYLAGQSVTKARGHGKTPEHGIKDAIKHPEKNREYLRKHPVSIGQRGPAYRADLEDRALASMDAKLGLYLKYNRDRVIAKIGKQSIRELLVTIEATEDELVELARSQRKGNPWHYH
jgi:hypothetical protein